MAKTGGLTIVWGDGEQVLRLGLGELEELDDKTGKGPELLFNELRGGSWHVTELRQILRLALIGGGKPAEDAFVFVQRYFVEGKLIMMRQLAMTVLSHALAVPDETEVDEPPMGKPTGDQAPGSDWKTDGSILPPSSETPLPSASGPVMSSGGASTSITR